MQAHQNLRSIWYIDSTPLSPIPEIPNSATISPELSPEPTAATSQSTKVISSATKLKRPKKSEKRELNIRIDKKFQRPNNPSKKTEKSQNTDLDSLDIYKKNKKEVLKLIPEVSRPNFYLSPERPESSRIVKKSSSRRISAPRVYEESKQCEKLPKIQSKHSEAKINTPKKGKILIDALSPLKQKRDLNFFKLYEETSHEVQSITKLMLNKASK